MIQSDGILAEEKSAQVLGTAMMTPDQGIHGDLIWPLRPQIMLYVVIIGQQMEIL